MHEHDDLHINPLSRLTPHLYPQADYNLCAQLTGAMVSACKEGLLVWVGRFELAAIRINLCVHFQGITSQTQPRRVMCHCTIGSETA
jgi:hypothetical protein